MTGEKIGFFGLEVELWRIGESSIAPKFNIVSKPNEWTKTVATRANAAKNAALTPAKELQLEFWTAFKEYSAANSAAYNTTKAHPQHWMNISIGRSGFKLCAIASLWDSESESYDSHEVRAELAISNDHAKNYFAQLEEQKETIEAALGESVVWHNPENRNACRLYTRKTTDLNNRERWPEYFEWLQLKLELFQRVFAPRIRVLEVREV